MTLLELIKEETTVSPEETAPAMDRTEAAAAEAPDFSTRNRWIAGALLVAGLALAISGTGIVGSVAAALALGTASALMVFDPASQRHFDRSGR